MFSAPSRRLLIVVALVVLAAAGLGLIFWPRPPKPQPPPDGPVRLAVLVVFDQLRGDYLINWDGLFGPDGFRRLDHDGAWFQNCHYPYANTVTAAGHASVSTGCPPAKHGIVGNNWYDPKERAAVYCVGNDRYERIPPVKVEVKPDGSEEKKPRGFAPDRLLAPTLADALKLATHGEGKVVSLSFKDRSAILPGGQSPDVCVWLDSGAGTFVTSQFYKGLPSWVNDFNRGRPADRWFGREWKRERPELDYASLSGPDDRPGEGKGTKQGVTFPHPTDGGEKSPGKNYYEALYNSPFGNELLLQLVERAVDEEKLGAHDAPDLLCVSFSSNDPIGHCWGPESQEVLDVTLRSDAIVAGLLKCLDEKVGKGRYVLGLTADHGVCPLPEVTKAGGRDAGRISPKKLQADAEEFLTGKFGPNADKVKWLAAMVESRLWLNQGNLKDRKLDGDAVAAALADWLQQQPGVLKAYTRARLAALPEDDVIGRAVQRSTLAERCGDVTVVVKPNWLLLESLTGTTHGTPHPYDTHVPLIVFGPDVVAGVRQERVAPLSMAAILARGLHIEPPAAAEYGVPEGLFKPE